MGLAMVAGRETITMTNHDDEAPGVMFAFAMLWCVAFLLGIGVGFVIGWMVYA